ncbi:MAG: T9SS type A sorting domain-containing protein [Bacteroidota bacterium]
MKKILLSIFALASASFANAQCTELFISEYIEGTNNNKAIEIYNPTNATIALNSKYRLVRYSNADAQAVAEADNTSWINLGAVSISSYSTFVFVLDKRDAAGTGQEAPISASLKAKADALIAQNPVAGAYICPVYNTNNTLYHNGNDAIGLQKETSPGVWTFVDIFGRIGECPIGYSDETNMVLESSNPCASSTAGWSDLAPYSAPPAGYNTAAPPTGQGFYFKRVWTTDHSLKRKATIREGVTTNPAAQTFNPSVQWDSTYTGQSLNNFSNLGSHTCDCQPSSIKNEFASSKNKLDVFPVPANNELNIVSDAAFSALTISSVVGQLVVSVNPSEIKGKNEYTFDTSNLEAGIYFVKVDFADKSSINRKIVISK